MNSGLDAMIALIVVFKVVLPALYLLVSMAPRGRSGATHRGRRR